LTTAEVTHGEPVVLINEAAAKLWHPGGSPIGARVHLNIMEKPPQPAAPSVTPDFTIVGVIGDIRNDGLRSPTRPAAYLPYTILGLNNRMLALRTTAAPMSLLNAVRERVRAIDKDQPLTQPVTLQEVLGQAAEQPRFNVALFSFFGLLGLALAAVGIYSMLSYTVARRTHEIGIRMALGAGRGDVLRQMLAMGGRLVLIGLGAGLIGSVALVKYLQSEVFQIPGTDPLSLTGVVVVLSAAAMLACLAPARRASKLNPMVALRHD